jgi:tetratricopeptide (TPR) repeat protein
LKFRVTLLILFFVSIISQVFSQTQTRVQGYDDANAARQYVNWAKTAIDEGRWSEALAGLERAADFANVSSDVSYQLALARSHEGKNRNGIIESLDHALDVNRWVIYNKNDALLLKAQQLIAMRKFSSALSILDDTVSNSDSVCLRLMSLKGLAAGIGDSGYNAITAAERFRTLMLSAMDRYPRDPRPLRIFFEYARNRKPELSQMPQSDLNILELALRRLPFLLESDAELAWMAAPFMRSVDDARRIMLSYRAGGLSGVQSRDFRPRAESIPVALNLGLIDDITAVEEFFSGTRGINSPLPPGISANGDPVIDFETLNKISGLLRSEMGRDLFTQRLLVFSGAIISDDDHDGFIDSITYYRSGVIEGFAFDMDQDNVSELRIKFLADVPASAEYIVSGQVSQIIWERYPSVERVTFADEIFSFRPAHFQFQPVSYIVLGGSGIYAGLPYPVLSYRLDLTRRTFVSFCVDITRPSVEFKGAVEKIFFERGFPVQAVEIIGGQYVSFTEFERGIPVIQYLDLDADGRMETVRRFYRPGVNYLWPDENEKYDYRKLIASSESDWTGKGRYKTGEVYLQDGAVVYLWDMDGSGVMDYSGTEN